MKLKIMPIAVALFTVGAGVVAVKLPGTSPGEINPRRTAITSPQARRAAPDSVLDLSAAYGKVNKTVFNKKTRVVFSSPQEFFADSGVRSFSPPIKFDDLSRLPPDLCMVSGKRLTREEIETIENNP